MGVLFVGRGDRYGVTVCTRNEVRRSVRDGSTETGSREELFEEELWSGL